MIKCVTTPMSIPCQNNLSYLNSENNIRGMYTPVCPSLCKTNKPLSCLFIENHYSNVITVEK